MYTFSFLRREFMVVRAQKGIVPKEVKTPPFKGCRALFFGLFQETQVSQSHPWRARFQSHWQVFRTKHFYRGQTLWSQHLLWVWIAHICGVPNDSPLDPMAAHAAPEIKMASQRGLRFRCGFLDLLWSPAYRHFHNKALTLHNVTLFSQIHIILSSFLRKIKINVESPLFPQYITENAGHVSTETFLPGRFSLRLSISASKCK